MIRTTTRGTVMLAAVLALPAPGVAQVWGPTYRCTDDAGRSTYTNTKEEMVGRKCVMVSKEITPQNAPAWRKSRGSEEDLARSKGQCLAQSELVPDSEAQRRFIVFEACMRGNGWSYQ